MLASVLTHDLLDALAVPAAVEVRLQEDANELAVVHRRHEAARQTDDVTVVVLAEQPRKVRTADRCRADARHLVGREGHADARAADQNAAVCPALGDGVGNGRGEVRIVDAAGIRGAKVLDLMAETANEVDNKVFLAEASLV